MAQATDFYMFKLRSTSFIFYNKENRPVLEIYSNGRVLHRGEEIINDAELGKEFLEWVNKMGGQCE